MAIWLVLMICICIVFSCGDDSVVRCSELTSPPFCGIVALSHGLQLARGNANKCLRWWGEEGVSLLRIPAPVMPLQRDNACEALAKLILLSCDISAYPCNLVCDPVAAHVRDLFIQVHWGSRGKSPCYTGTLSPLFSGDPALVSCVLTISQWRDWWFLLVVPLTTCGACTQRLSALSHYHQPGNIWPFWGLSCGFKYAEHASLKLCIV